MRYVVFTKCSENETIKFSEDKKSNYLKLIVSNELKDREKDKRRVYFNNEMKIYYYYYYILGVYKRYRKCYRKVFHNWFIIYA